MRLVPRLSLPPASREIYHLLKNGVRVPVPDPEGDGETVEVVRVKDWDNPDNNVFLICYQFWITGNLRDHKDTVPQLACANVAPRIVSDIYDKYVAGDIKGSQKAQFRLAPLSRIAFSLGTFPSVIKESLAILE